jgi:uncharacterized membrane protein
MSERILAIDRVRGVVMILMVLDHVRYFFTDVPFAPENMEKTWPALFFTRWVTHFCAPLFFLLAGTSAFLGRAKPADLALRGLWLVALELTIIGFAWQFTPGYSFAGVIWALGWSMVALAALSRLPALILFAVSALVISFDVSKGSPNLLFRPGTIEIFGTEWFVLYPIVPWLAIMTLGYSLGPIWLRAPRQRQQILLIAGMLGTAAFVVLRSLDPALSPGLGFLNTEKYPPSLQFTLMTIGPGLIALTLADRWLESTRGVVLTFGRVPMFFYVCHLYLIHLLALIVAIASGQPHAWLGWNPPETQVPPPGYGWPLPVVWTLWVIVVLLLYPPSRWFERIKRERPNRWLRYV